MEWLPIAQALPINGKRKIKHCGSSPSLSISANLKGFRAYCHRCEWQAYEPRQHMPSIAEIAEARMSLRKMRECRGLPSDFSMDFHMEHPLDAWSVTWLATSGITQSLRNAYSLGISNTYQSCIIPVKQGKADTVLGFIARRWQHYATNSGPKYVEVLGNSESAVFLSLADRVTLYPQGQYTVHCVVVEDALSAMKVGECIPSGSMLGTSLGMGKLEQLVRHSGVSDPVVGIWMDPDKAGAKSAKLIEQRLDLMGVKSVRIHSEKDPKKYSVRQIRNILGDRRSVPADYEAQGPVFIAGTPDARGIV